MTTPLEPFRILPDIDTPCLVVDIDRVSSNIKRMADGLRERGVSLRPHAKTHKSIEVAKLQLEAGARGLTVATLHEAAVFAHAGFDDIFVAFTLWPSIAKVRQIRSLLQRMKTLSVGVDSVDAATALGEALGVDAHRLQVLVEVDSGSHRCGVDPRQAGDVATAAARAGLKVVGAFTHGGHAYDGKEAIQPAADDERNSLQLAAESLQAQGHVVHVLSAGSSPSALYSARPPVTEERPGEYVFGDLDLLSLGVCKAEDVALMVVGTVVSTAVDGQFVIDVGSKTLGHEPPSGLLKGYGQVVGYPLATFDRLSEEHGVVTVNGGQTPMVGDVVRIIPNHVCPVVNLADEMVAVRDGEVVALWQVDARGHSLQDAQVNELALEW